MPPVLQPQQNRNKPSRVRLSVGALGIVALAGLVASWYVVTTPSRGVVSLDVERGMTAADVADMLHEQGVVRSATVARAILLLSGKSGAIRAGTYRVDTETSGTIFAVAQHILSGDVLSTEKRVTIPEGSRGEDILAAVHEAFPGGLFATTTAAFFDDTIGFLFPDTYSVDVDTTPEMLRARMRERYEEQMASLRADIIASGMTEKQVITFASLLEREGNSEDAMRRIAGVIRNRLKQGMRLQLDAPLEFLLGKTSAELTQDDLALASPYNTYRVEGLPPAPIANPGRMAIEAVLHPISSDYLFYLTAPDGTFYYAKTFAEHIKNKEKYLR